MSSLSFSPAARVGGERGNFVSGSNILIREQILGSDLQKCPFYGSGGATNRRRLSVSAAKIRKGKKHDYPWPKVIDPNLESGHLSYLSQFKSLTEKPKPVTLAFEKPLVDLEKKITDVSSSDCNVFSIYYVFISFTWHIYISDYVVVGLFKSLTSEN